MNILLISASLNPRSRSRVMLRALRTHLEFQGAAVTFLDLQETPLPMCDGNRAYDDPRVAPVSKMIEQANAVLIGVPVYNFDVNAAAKNLVELTGSVWDNKPVGFVCAAGGRSSYMSVMSFANSLMLDFRCLIVPRFVYASRGDFTATGEVNDEIDGRLRKLAAETLHLAGYGRNFPVQD